MSLYKKMFVSAKWNIAIRKRQNVFFSYNEDFITVPCEDGFWLADPMLYEKNGNDYLFCEAYDEKNQIGKIAVFDIIDGIPKNFRMIMEYDCHLSYPCIFEVSGCCYMIPETGEDKKIKLYKANRFPDAWRLVGELANGKTYSDSTVIVENEKIYLLTYYCEAKRFYNEIYEIDVELCSAKKIKCIEYAENFCRPAGMPLYEQGDVFVPFQDCRTTYGSNIGLKRVTLPDCSVDGNVIMLEKNNVSVDGKKNLDRIHTYSRTCNYEAIDYGRCVFDLFKRVRICKRKFMKKRRKNI